MVGPQSEEIDFGPNRLTLLAGWRVLSFLARGWLRGSLLRANVSLARRLTTFCDFKTQERDGSLNTLLRSRANRLEVSIAPTIQEQESGLT